MEANHFSVKQFYKNGDLKKEQIQDGHVLNRDLSIHLPLNS